MAEWNEESVNGMLSKLDGGLQAEVKSEGNLMVTFGDLRQVKPSLNDSGVELMSRGEVIARAQLEAIDALREQGVPVRMANERAMTKQQVMEALEAGKTIFTTFPTLWCNRTEGRGRGSNAETSALRAEVNSMKSQIAENGKMMAEMFAMMKAARSGAPAPTPAAEETEVPM